MTERRAQRTDEPINKSLPITDLRPQFDDLPSTFLLVAVVVVVVTYVGLFISMSKLNLLNTVEQHKLFT